MTYKNLNKMEPFKVVCINDWDRPDDIPKSKWLKRGELYTVILVGKMMIQGGKLGFKLAELNIDDCFPYQFFSAERFALPAPNRWVEEVLEKALQEAKEEFQKNPIAV